MKTCGRCKQSKSLDEFASRGQGYKHTYCKECVRAYNRNYYKTDLKNRRQHSEHNRRRQQEAREYIIKAKDAPCTDCKVKYPFYVMQFDHVRGKKRVNLAQAHVLAIKTIQAEIEKCDLVCANCHAERTHSRRTSSVRTS